MLVFICRFAVKISFYLTVGWMFTSKKGREVAERSPVNLIVRYMLLSYFINPSSFSSPT